MIQIGRRASVDKSEKNVAFEAVQDFSTERTLFANPPVVDDRMSEGPSSN